MVNSQDLQQQLHHTLDRTSLDLPNKHQGKVRDSYVVDDKRLIITTDRISAFDRVLCSLPYKGQVLNQTAAFWFEKTKHIIPNHVIDVPHPNALLATQCQLIPVEMVVRGYLTGSTKTSAWYNYENGVRNFCGNELPEGMVKNQKFDTPIITPSTKPETGHDESLSADELINRGIVNRETFDKMADAALKLYTFGEELVAKNNLILVDTKYEFGLLNGELVLIDEVHTPDSSRFWIKDTYESKFTAGDEPDKLDKEYVRLWLAEQGFLGDGDIPQIPDNIKVEAASRYIKAYEMITGQPFEASVGSVQEQLTSALQNKGLL